MPPRILRPENRRDAALKLFNQIAAERAKLEIERSHIEARLEALKRWELDAIEQLKAADQALADNEVRTMLLQLPAERKSTNGYVYILKAHDGLHKIGRTSDPADRLKTFSIKLPFPVEYELLIEADDMFALERVLHQEFREYQVNGEWFKLSAADVDYIRRKYIEGISDEEVENVETIIPLSDEIDDGQTAIALDNTYDRAIELVRTLNKASVSLLQQRLRIGYTRASRIIQRMEAEGIIGAETGNNRPREVLPIN